MNIKQYTQEGVTVVEIQGTLDHIAAAQLNQAAPLWAAGRHTRLLVDLSRVGCFFASGLGGLVAVHSAVEAGGGRVLFAVPHPFFREMLRLTQADRLVQVVAERGVALEMLSQGPKPKLQVPNRPPAQMPPGNPPAKGRGRAPEG